MGKSDTTAELQKLREELEKLRKSSAPAGEQLAQTGLAAEAVAELESLDDSAETDTPNELKNQVDELLELLKHEVGELPTVTCVVVFSLGILMGRLLR